MSVDFEKLNDRVLEKIKSADLATELKRENVKGISDDVARIDEIARISAAVVIAALKEYDQQLREQGTP